MHNDGTEAMNTSALSSKGRDMLLRLVRVRKKLARIVVAERSAKLKADFERQIAAIYTPHDNEAWAKVSQMARAAIDERCRLSRLVDRVDEVLRKLLAEQAR